MTLAPHARRNGRPSTLTQEVSDQLKAEFEKGASVTTAARVCGLSPLTVEKWIARGRGKVPDRKTLPEFVRFAQMVDDARAHMRSQLGGYVLEGAKKNPELALKLLERFEPEHWGPQVGPYEDPDDLPRLPPALAQLPDDGDEDESPSEAPDGAVTLQSSRTLTIPASRIEEFARMLRGGKVKDGNSGDDDLAGFREGTDLPSG